MTAFTDVTFGEDELLKIDKVMHLLTEEGWSVIGKIKSKKWHKSGEHIEKSIKYHLSREF